MSWKSAARTILSAAIAIAPASLVAQNTYRDWNVSAGNTMVIASTSAKTGAMLSYMCRVGADKCQWGIVIPDADCRPGSVVPVSFSSTEPPQILDALCDALPSIDGMPGTGRSFVLLGEPAGSASHIFGGSETASVQNTNGKLVRHRFSWNGWTNALIATQSTLQYLDPERSQRNQRPRSGWSSQPRYIDPGFGKAR